MYFKNKKITFFNLALSYIFLVCTFFIVSYQVFINEFEIYSEGMQIILSYNLAMDLFILIIFVILFKGQNLLLKDNVKLEVEIEKRTKKLNEYIGIVNKYVTISTTDLEGNITDISEAFCRISGYTREELIGQPHSIVKHTDTDPLIYKELWDTITEDKSWQGEVKKKKKNGDSYWVLANIDPIYSDSGKKIGYTSIRQDITDKKIVEKLSITDKLTQLYNRVKLDEVFTMEIAKFSRYNTGFSMILIDIDHFKDVNDTHGHNTGDSVLKEIVNILKSSVRGEDIVGRWGGEEFIILTNNCSINGVMSMAEKIRKNIEAFDFTTIGTKTASFGISILQKEDTQETMIARADEALFRAKNSGRNKVCFYQK